MKPTGWWCARGGVNHEVDQELGDPLKTTQLPCHGQEHVNMGLQLLLAGRAAGGSAEPAAGAAMVTGLGKNGAQCRGWAWWLPLREGEHRGSARQLRVPALLRGSRSPADLLSV